MRRSTVRPCHPWAERVRTKGACGPLASLLLALPLLACCFALLLRARDFLTTHRGPRGLETTSQPRGFFGSGREGGFSTKKDGGLSRHSRQKAPGSSERQDRLDSPEPGWRAPASPAVQHERQPGGLVGLPEIGPPGQEVAELGGDSLLEELGVGRGALASRWPRRRLLEELGGDSLLEELGEAAGLLARRRRGAPTQPAPRRGPARVCHLGLHDVALKPRVRPLASLPVSVASEEGPLPAGGPPRRVRRLLGESHLARAREQRLGQPRLKAVSEHSVQVTEREARQRGCRRLGPVSHETESFSGTSGRITVPRVSGNSAAELGTRRHARLRGCRRLGALASALLGAARLLSRRRLGALAAELGNSAADLGTRKHARLLSRRRLGALASARHCWRLGGALGVRSEGG